MPSAPRPKLVSTAVVAEQYGVSERTVRRWITSGLIAGFRIGPRLIRVDLEEVAEALRLRIPNARGVTRRGR